MQLAGGIWQLPATDRRAILAAETSSRSRWIAAQTGGGRELEALRNVEAQGFIGWLPTTRVWTSSAGTLRSRIEFLFPRFLFVLVRQRWNSLLGTRGITGVVMAGDQPGRLTESDLAWLRESEDASGCITIQTPARFRPGQKVSVKGISGVYECASARERCWVLLGVLGGARSEVPEIDVEPAAA